MSTVDQISGKVVAITGGARGIGYETARQLLARGAKVAIGDIDATRLAEAAAELGAHAHRELDVTSAESFAAFLAAVEAEVGEVDVLVNNAGIQPTGAVVDEPEALTRRTIEINLLGVIFGTTLALKLMLPRGRGHIVNTASLAGEMTLPGLATYCATKAAVISYTESVRLEYRGSGVEISGVRPTFTNTELISGTPGVPGFRNAEPGDIATAILGLIESPKPFVRVTKAAGRAVALLRFIPEPVRTRLSDKTGGGRMFLDDVDVEARAAYLKRIRSN